MNTRARSVVSLSSYCFVTPGNDCRGGGLIQLLEAKAFPFPPSLRFAWIRISYGIVTRDKKSSLLILLLLAVQSFFEG